MNRYGKSIIIIFCILLFAVAVQALNVTSYYGIVAPYFANNDGSFNTSGGVKAQKIGGVIYTDQYTTLQDAFNNGNEIYINKNYSITTAITVRADQHIFSSSIYNISVDSDINLFTFDPYAKNVEIEKLTIRGNNGTKNIFNGGSGGLDNLKIHDNNVENYSGLIVDLASSIGNDNVKIYSNNFSNVQYGIGIFGNYSNIYNNNISNINKNTSSSSEYGEGIDCNVPSKKCKIYNNNIYGFREEGIDIVDGEAYNNNIFGVLGEPRQNACITISNNIELVSNTFESCMIGVSFSGRNNKIIGNDFKDISVDAVDFGSSLRGTNVHSIISSNNFSNVSNGIEMIDISGLTIIGNTIQASNYGISVYGSASQPRDNIISLNNITATVRGISLANIGRSMVSMNMISSATPIHGTPATNSSVMNNYGAAPFAWGNIAGTGSTSPPSQFGNGDSYYNVTSNQPCWYRTSWQNATGDTDVC